MVHKARKTQWKASRNRLSSLISHLCLTSVYACKTLETYEDSGEAMVLLLSPELHLYVQRFRRAGMVRSGVPALRI